MTEEKPSTVNPSGVKMRAGHPVQCEIVKAEPGGYAVKLLPSELEGFLPSPETLKLGQTVPAIFVCMNSSRALLSFAFMIGTTATVQEGLPTESETAFAVWADSHPRTYKLRRAIDVVLPAASADEVREYTVGDANLKDVFDEIEQNAFTGCIKSECESRKSRSAALIYKGRVVGCIYGTRTPSDPYQTEVALNMMMLDFRSEDTAIKIYPLPDQVVLPMSAMFLGFPAPVDNFLKGDEDALVQSVVEICDELVERKETGCITATLPKSQQLCLVYVHAGKCPGFFNVDFQRFSASLEELQQLIVEDIDARLELFLLPSEMTSPHVTFGYSLTGAYARKPEFRI